MEKNDTSEEMVQKYQKMKQQNSSILITKKYFLILIDTANIASETLYSFTVVTTPSSVTYRLRKRKPNFSIMNEVLIAGIFFIPSLLLL